MLWESLSIQLCIRSGVRIPLSTFFVFATLFAEEREKWKMDSHKFMMSGTSLIMIDER